MIEAIVLGETEGSGYGTFRFSVLPSPGDRIVVGNNRGSCDILEVLYVEHHPVKMPPLAIARPDPWTSVVVAFHSSFGDT